MSKLYWHFLREDRKLGYGDGREVKVGETYRVTCEPILCEQGLHASEDIMDALFYSPGPILCKVRMGDDVIVGEDKVVSSSREVVEMLDASSLLGVFARKCALDVAHLWDAPDVVLEWLKTGDESLRYAARYDNVRDARNAASNAACYAARDARNAARDARDSARAARGATKAAASYADWGASDAASDAARAARDAARYSARYDAWDTSSVVGGRQRKHLLSLLSKAEWEKKQ